MALQDPPHALSKVHYLIANQLVGRGLTFLLNLLVARAVGREVFGVQAVNLYLLNTLILFLSREGIRRSIAADLMCTLT